MTDDLKIWQPDHAVAADMVGRDGSEPIQWHVAEEAPVALVYNGHNHAVMMASPMDLLDYAYGFSFSEGIIDRVEDIRAVEVRERSQGIDLLITLTDEKLERFKVRQERRALVGNSSCGLCGIDSMENLFAAPKPVADEPLNLVYKHVISAVADFQQQQPLKKLNKSAHGAGWVNNADELTYVREDVGRHNAVDKLIGALLRAGVRPDQGYGIVSSRASYEIVSKAIRARMPAMVSLSAPSAFAIRTARDAKLTLVNWAFEGMAVFE